MSSGTLAIQKVLNTSINTVDGYTIIFHVQNHTGTVTPNLNTNENLAWQSLEEYSHNRYQKVGLCFLPKFLLTYSF